jgi:serine/threonine protein kinase
VASSPASDDFVEDLIARAVQALEQRGEEGLQAFLAEHETNAGAVRDGLERLRRLGILAPPPPAPTEGTRYGDFKVLRRIGAGGMGVVYAAEQTSLGRTVALKVVRPEFLQSRIARERFQREIEAIARLAHPGIVPILAVGNEDTQPWFAMEYVEGTTLDELVQRMQGKDPARADGSALRSMPGGAAGKGTAGSSLFAGSQWEVCVRIVHQVATTMAYVHERGIVHRDLKPSNIRLTPQGQALVLDFGLAHVRDLNRVTHGDRPLGSPAYAAPEQLRGEAVDERVDVYGLGVTLYELLATHLPFGHDNRDALQAAILAGSARPVRTWNRAVPRDLEIVCAVAMDRDRARRYRSMADFAADLDAVLARRPIDARPLGVGLRLVRFAQRHPTWAIAACAVALLALQFPLVLWRWQAGANEVLAKVNGDLAAANIDLGKTNTELEHQRAIAVSTFTDALDAVKQVLTESAQNEVVALPGSELAQLAILRRADAMYERLRNKRPNNRRVEFDSARNLEYMGIQISRLGDTRGAEQCYRDALERVAPWNGVDFEYVTGSLWRFVGLELGRQGRTTEELAAYELALCHLETVAPTWPFDRTPRRELAEALASLGIARARIDHDGATDLLLRAQAIKDALYAESPNDLGGALTCALGCDHLAGHLQAEQPENAERWLVRGITILTQFVPTGKEEAALRSQLAGLFDARGQLCLKQRRHAEAEDDHGKALALRISIAQDFPSVANNWFEVACSLNNLAMVRAATGDATGAAELWTDAVARFQQAARMAPKRTDYAAGLATSLANLVELAMSQRRFDDAAAALPDLVAANAPPAAQLQCARLCARLAVALRARARDGDPEAAQTWCDRAAELVETAIARGWKDRSHFDSPPFAKQYSVLRDHPRFLDALDRLPPVR